MVDSKVARAAASSSLRDMLLAVLLLTTLTGGCARKGMPEIRRAGAPREGYAYTAVLMSRHPLYRAVAELERALDELGEDKWEPALEPITGRFEDLALLENLALAAPAERLAMLERDWRAAYPELSLPEGALSPDLQTRIEWDRRLAQREIARQMAAARAAEGRRLARLHAELTARYQERLTNLRINGKLGDDEAARRASREVARVEAAIEAEMEAERRAGEELLVELEQRLRRQAQERIAAARERADQVADERGEQMRAVGADLYQQMIDEVSRPWQGASPSEVGAVAAADDVNARVDVAEGLRSEAEMMRREAIAEQRRHLLRALARLRAQLKTGTETAALVVAYRDGIDLQLLPGGTARGEDMTAVIADKLAEYWHTAEGKRS